jgi:hypothetical protein
VLQGRGRGKEGRLHDNDHDHDDLLLDDQAAVAAFDAYTVHSVDDDDDSDITTTIIRCRRPMTTRSVHSSARSA